MSKKLLLATLFIYMFTGVSCTTEETAKEELTAEKPAEENVDSAPVDENNVDSIFKKFADTISNASSIKVNVETGFDALQVVGQNLEFGDYREIYIQRPDKAHIKATWRNGDIQVFNFDGTNLTFSNPAQKVYAQVEKPGTVDEAIDFIVDALQTPVPLSEILSSDFNTRMGDLVRSKALINVTNINGFDTYNIALRNENVDAQIWLNVSNYLPVRLKLNYKKEPGNPQFWANFSNWELNGAIDENIFNVNYKDFEKIQFSPIN